MFKSPMMLSEIKTKIGPTLYTNVLMLSETHRKIDDYWPRYFKRFVSLQCADLNFDYRAKAQHEVITLYV